VRRLSTGFWRLIGPPILNRTFRSIVPNTPYIAYVNESVMLPGERLEFELEYLEFVANYL